MTLQATIEKTIIALGYDLIELERSAGGLLRVTIDFPWQISNGSNSISTDDANANFSSLERFITIDDCEKVTRQLQLVLEVENYDYRRLEVSSPGIDRPLRGEQDFKRFEGHIVDIVLKAPIGSSAITNSQSNDPLITSNATIAANRKRFRGLLQRVDQTAQWTISWREEPKVKPGQRVSKKRVLPPIQIMSFNLDELREARLAPIVNFKGKDR